MKGGRWRSKKVENGDGEKDVDENMKTVKKRKLRDENIVEKQKIEERESG